MLNALPVTKATTWRNLSAFAAARKAETGYLVFCWSAARDDNGLDSNPLGTFGFCTLRVGIVPGRQADSDVDDQRRAGLLGAVGVTAG